MQCEFQFQLFHTVHFIRQKHHFMFLILESRFPEVCMEYYILQNMYNVSENVSGVCSTKLFEYMFAHY